VKPVIKEEKIRLGLLMRNGSIHRPEANSQASKNPTMIAVRISVTVNPRMDNDALVGAAAVASGAAIGAACRPIFSGI
jgi:hypothetical protein